MVKCRNVRKYEVTGGNKIEYQKTGRDIINIKYFTVFNWAHYMDWYGELITRSSKSLYIFNNGYDAF